MNVRENKSPQGVRWASWVYEARPDGQRQGAQERLGLLVTEHARREKGGSTLLDSHLPCSAGLDRLKVPTSAHMGVARGEPR